MHYFNAFPKLSYDLRAVIDGGKSETFSTSIPNLYRTNSAIRTLIDDRLAYQYYDIRDGERPDIVSYNLYGSVNYYWSFFIVNDFLRADPRCWPLSQKELKRLVEREYDGKVLVTYSEDVVGKFIVGETVVGGKKGATGTVSSLRPELGQVILKDHVGVFGSNETFTGQTSGDFITTDATVDLLYATYAYRRSSDGTEASHEFFFQDGELDADLSEISFWDKLIEVNDEHSRIKVIRPEKAYPFLSEYYRLLKSA